MNCHVRREARCRGCLGRYGVSVASPVIHEPENCDGTCHAGGLAAPRSAFWCLVVLLLARFAGSLGRWSKCAAAPASGDLCECGAHYLTDRPSRMGWARQLTPEQRYVHEQDSAWELALWDRQVARREAAELGAKFRRALARKRAAAVARVLRLARAICRPRRDDGPPALGRVVVLCHPRTGPPAAPAASEALVIYP